MQIGPGFPVDDFRRERAHRGMLAVEQHQRRPVLARISALHRAVHFRLLGRLIVVLHAIDGLVALRVSGKPGDIGQEQKIAIAEQRPTLVAGKARSEKPRIGEFGRGQRILIAPVKFVRAQLVELDRLDVDQNRCAPLERKLGHVVSDRFAFVPADKNTEWRCHAAPFVIGIRMFCGSGRRCNSRLAASKKRSARAVG